MIEKGLIALTIFLIVPELIGLLVLKIFGKEKDNLVFAFVLGYLLEFSICQLVSVPLIYKDATLTQLVNILTIIFGILSIISIVFLLKDVVKIIKKIFNYIKAIPKFLAFLTIILVGIQIYAYAAYMHIDDDDAFYVGTATTAVQTDTIFKYAGSTGEENGENMASRYRLGPFPVYSAVISKLIDIHPAIVSHTIFPIIFIPLVYMVYGLIADELFNKNQKSVYTFLLLTCIVSIWGNYSVRSTFSFLLIRIWQGKSLLANLILPATILCFLKAEKNEYNFRSCVLLFVTIFAGTFTTTMGIALPPLSLMLLAIACELSKINLKMFSESRKETRKEKENIKLRIKNIVKCLVCCVPAIIYGVAYLLI